MKVIGHYDVPDQFERLFRASSGQCIDEESAGMITTEHRHPIVGYAGDVVNKVGLARFEQIHFPRTFMQVNLLNSPAPFRQRTCPPDAQNIPFQRESLARRAHKCAV